MTKFYIFLFVFLIQGNITAQFYHSTFILKGNNKLPWKQYLNLNQSEAGKLNIEAFPVTFLLNEKGGIISKNTEPEEFKKISVEKL